MGFGGRVGFYALVLSVGLSVAPSAFAIFDGKVTSGHRFVRLIYRTATGQGDPVALCTAVKIAPGKLLTAAHCVSARALGPGGGHPWGRAKPANIRLQALSGGAASIAMRRIWVPDRYYLKMNRAECLMSQSLKSKPELGRRCEAQSDPYDLAVLEFDDALDDGHAPVAPRWRPEVLPPLNALVTLVGFGRSERDIGPRKIEVAHRRVGRAWVQKPLTDSLAGVVWTQGGASGGQGDSGGALLYRGKLVGVLVAQDDCGGAPHCRVTRVASLASVSSQAFLREVFESSGL